MKTGQAFLAGVVGGAVMTILTAIGRLLGLDVNLEMMLGTMLLPPSAVAWIVGLAMHLLISGLIAIAYAAGFERVTHRAGASVGLAFSVIHIVIGGLFMGLVPALHRLIPEQMAAPGAFLSNHGAVGVISFLVLHAIYGAIVGAMYAPAVHEAPGRITTRRPRMA
ncbi:MAG: hypothetical protein M3Y87_25050 [Myxococcota bacterium]|nr:hypothetical protein [Myxococcota bacterium]